MANNELAKVDNRFNESIFKRVRNQLIVGLLTLISKLPFSVLYRISDFICFILQKIIRYRKNVIFENLHYSFPKKNKEEIEQIANKFYRHFSDLIVETIKMNGMSKAEISEHIKFKNMGRFEKLYNANQSLIVLGFHHSNWEWASAIQLHCSHQLLMLYNPVRGNFSLEKFILHAREKWGGKSIPVHKSGRTVLELNRAGKPTGLWLGADQTPPASSKFWTTFLNREAPFFSGPEKIAAKTNQPIYFHRTKKIARGYYEVELLPLVENPKDVDQKEILLRYVRKMEEVIREEPEYYLWSHRRWKHTRPEGIPLS